MFSSVVFKTTKTNYFAFEQLHGLNSNVKPVWDTAAAEDRHVGQGFAKREHFVLLVRVKELLAAFFRPLSFRVGVLRGITCAALRCFVLFYFILYLVCLLCFLLY